MRPVSRIRARAEALESLGATPGATSEEIRSAWKRAAFESHPDRSEGDMSEFIKAKSAYEFLKESEDIADVLEEEAAPSTSSNRPRPRPATRIVDFNEDIVTKCSDLLGETRESTEDVIFLDGESAIETDEPVTDHIADAVVCKGRTLTYLVAANVARGVNRVGLPTALLENPRKPKPRVIAFSFDEEGSFEIDIPNELRNEISSGARQMKIRFEKTESA